MSHWTLELGKDDEEPALKRMSRCFFASLQIIPSRLLSTSLEKKRTRMMCPFVVEQSISILERVTPLLVSVIQRNHSVIIPITPNGGDWTLVSSYHVVTVPSRRWPRSRCDSWRGTKVFVRVFLPDDVHSSSRGIGRSARPARAFVGHSVRNTFEHKHWKMRRIHDAAKSCCAQERCEWGWDHGWRVLRQSKCDWHSSIVETMKRSRRRAVQWWTACPVSEHFAFGKVSTDPGCLSMWTPRYNYSIRRYFGRVSLTERVQTEHWPNSARWKRGHDVLMTSTIPSFFFRFTAFSST